MIHYIILLKQDSDFVQNNGTEGLNIWDFICCQEESTDIKIFNDFSDALDYRRKHEIEGVIVKLPIKY